MLFRIKISLFILLCSNLFSQSDSTITYTYSNTVSGMYSDNNLKQLNINFNGDNSIVKGKKSFNSNTNYSFAHTIKSINNELLQKTNISYENLFISHIFNRSLVREIKYNNLIGVGCGYKWKYLSLSYASMYENTIYDEKTIVNVFRHSIRAKTKYEHNLFSVVAEYYYQPNMHDPEDVVIYGTTKINLLKKNKLSFTIADILNYRSMNKIKSMHTISIGISYNLKINK